ncbi:MAG: rhodanese-like domain-containing protein [Pseudomonadota bacterium]
MRSPMMLLSMFTGLLGVVAVSLAAVTTPAPSFAESKAAAPNAASAALPTAAAQSGASPERVSVAPAAEYPPLAAVISDVKENFDGVTHLSPSQVAELAQRDDVLLVDTREAEEYAVSRLPGAVRIDPDAWSWSVVPALQEAAKNKHIVFYCSVGVRSSRMAEHVQEELLAQGAKSIANMSGGIFSWHNAGGTLTDGARATAFVHPYDETWGKMLSRKELARYSPVPATQ